MEEFKPKTKEKWRKDCSIQVKTLMDVTENPKGSFKNEFKLINIKITKPEIISSCSFKLTKYGKKQALNFIKRELFL